MYLSFYNLLKEPFNITPDPELLFLSPTHKEALAAIIYGVEKRKGFISVVGEVGVGKTTVLRAFLERTVEESCRVIYIFNPHLSFVDLLKTIITGMGKAPQEGDTSEMVEQLHRMLIEEYRVGRNVALIIDEAQQMPVATLENLRILSNLETASEKLIQIVFSGQPEFEAKLELHQLRQLKQRIAVRAHIRHLTPKESTGYIRHRLSRTLMADSPLFTKLAEKRIVSKAKGIPRVINILCDNCLITAFGRRQRRVNDRVAREIARDLGLSKGWAWLRRAGLMAGLLAGGVIYWSYAKVGLLPKQATETTIFPSHGVHSAADIDVTTGSPGERAEVAEVKTSDPVETRTVVKSGDTLSSLMRRTYGTADSELLRLVKMRNRSITDEDKIVCGDVIYFPSRTPKENGQ